MRKFHIKAERIKEESSSLDAGASLTLSALSSGDTSILSAFDILHSDAQGRLATESAKLGGLQKPTLPETPLVRVHEQSLPKAPDDALAGRAAAKAVDYVGINALNAKEKVGVLRGVMNQPRGLMAQRRRAGEVVTYGGADAAAGAAAAAGGDEAPPEGRRFATTLSQFPSAFPTPEDAEAEEKAAAAEKAARRARRRERRRKRREQQEQDAKLIAALEGNTDALEAAAGAGGGGGGGGGIGEGEGDAVTRMSPIAGGGMDMVPEAANEFGQQPLLADSEVSWAQELRGEGQQQQQQQQQQRQSIGGLEQKTTTNSTLLWTKKGPRQKLVQNLDSRRLVTMTKALVAGARGEVNLRRNRLKQQQQRQQRRRLRQPGRQQQHLDEGADLAGCADPRPLMDTLAEVIEASQKPANRLMMIDAGIPGLICDIISAPPPPPPDSGDGTGRGAGAGATAGAAAAAMGPLGSDGGGDDAASRVGSIAETVAASDISAASFVAGSVPEGPEGGVGGGGGGGEDGCRARSLLLTSPVGEHRDLYRRAISALACLATTQAHRLLILRQRGVVDTVVKLALTPWYHPAATLEELEAEAEARREEAARRGPLCERFATLKDGVITYDDGGGGGGGGANTGDGNGGELGSRRRVQQVAAEPVAVVRLGRPQRLDLGNGGGGGGVGGGSRILRGAGEGSGSGMMNSRISSVSSIASPT
eukprot:g1669.t1